MGVKLCSNMGSGFCGKIGASWSKMEERLNDAVSKSFVGKYFKLEDRGSCLTKELRAGTATFLTMAYVITVNATILTDSGGTCSASDCSPPPGNVTAPADCMLKHNVGYENCLSKIKNDLIVATIVSSMIASFAMGIFANLPLGLGPGMGPNAYFAYNLVGFHGSGPLPYRTATAVVLVEGCAFLLLSAFGFRSKLARVIPVPVRVACAAGIGVFIAFVGLQAQQGLGLVGPDPSTLVTITGCTRTDPMTGACTGGKMRSPTVWLGLVGFIITSYGLMKEIKGSMIYGILFVTLVSWIRGTQVTYFPYNPQGDERYKYFQKVVDFHEIESTAGVISFANFNKSEVWVALVTLLYVDMLATTGILYTMAEVGGFLDENGKFEGEYLAYIVDAGSTIIGSTLGVSPTATYVESSAGMREGGRTGLTAIVIGMYFFLALFFTPLLISVPPWAIGPSLVMVGATMMKVVKDIDWVNIKHGVPAFITIILMPLTYSISNGIVGGLAMYVMLSLYDYTVELVRWFPELKRKVVKGHSQASATEQNQVSSTEQNRVSGSNQDQVSASDAGMDPRSEIV